MKIRFNTKNVKKMMIDKDLNIEKLAKRLYTSRTVVSNWLNHRNMPDWSNLEMLCELFNCTLDDLFILDKDVAIANEIHYMGSGTFEELMNEYERKGS